MITPTSELAEGCEVERSRVSHRILLKNKVPSTYSHDSFMPYSLDTANSKQHGASWQGGTLSGRPSESTATSDPLHLASSAIYLQFDESIVCPPQRLLRFPLLLYSSL
ncbi:Uncharacterized protein HZ326_0445 [Fusarium oxysporum f. sp. albedinis]|nr:Uncharacterized protein HZ326_0445 [Fusarium oxysporum f. sp. albedinis]